MRNLMSTSGLYTNVCRQAPPHNEPTLLEHTLHISRFRQCIVSDYNEVCNFLLHLNIKKLISFDCYFAILKYTSILLFQISFFTL